MNYIQPDWPAPPSIKAYTTLRSAWQGKESLGMSLPLPAEPIWIAQVHSILAVKAIPENNGKEADAVFTNELHRVCVVITADCLPILICDKQGTQVAAIHAGWRGLAAGIIESTLDQMKLSSNDLLVWLGPAIGPKQFEVGRDVYDAFTLRHPQTATAFSQSQSNHWFADLYALAKIRLALRGIKQIYGGNYCTFTQKELFFSYRRDKGIIGHIASAIWIDGDHK